MARDLSLGPSVAPCTVETSTAHGDLSLWATDLPYGFIKSFWSSPAESDKALCLLPPFLLPPEKLSSSQPPLKAQVSRPLHLIHGSTKTKLGFLLEGLKPIFGPFALLRPKPIRCSPNFQGHKTRFA